jgi:hypothetical protein
VSLWVYELGVENWHEKRTFSCERALLSFMLKIKTEEDRIIEDFLWLGRNIPSLQKEYEER